MTRIVVGVDGSPNSVRALKRAVEEGVLRDGTIEAIYAYRPAQRSLADELVRMPPGLGGPTAAAQAERTGRTTDSGELQRRAETHLERFIHDTLDGADAPALKAIAVPSNHPTEALISATQHADLLVIGTRGFGGFAGMLLGSVAHQVIQHAHCPVLIVRGDEAW